MPSLDLSFGDGAWADLGPGELTEGHIERATILGNGTVGGKPVVAFLIRLPDGTSIVTQLTWALFESAHAAFRGAIDGGHV